jgi:hypothetical protein
MPQTAAGFKSDDGLAQGAVYGARLAPLTEELIFVIVTLSFMIWFADAPSHS